MAATQAGYSPYYLLYLPPWGYSLGNLRWAIPSLGEGSFGQKYVHLTEVDYLKEKHERKQGKERQYRSSSVSLPILPKLADFLK